MSVTIKGLDSLTKRIERMTNSLQSKIPIFLERLAQIGVATAAAKFSMAQYDGTNDVNVTAHMEGANRIVITAAGEAVLFIEFGSGVIYTEQHPKASEMGAIRGGYGQGKGNQSAWGFYGEAGTNGQFVKTTDKGDVYVTHGNPPARAMYEADKAIVASVLQIAKEIFTS
ncbi:MAG: hypothetical protein GX051_00335 [Clostridiales bacterium]|nr:hypothetical protein [Clostridiales bacterium]